MSTSEQNSNIIPRARVMASVRHWKDNLWKVSPIHYGDFEEFVLESTFEELNEKLSERGVVTELA